VLGQTANTPSGHATRATRWSSTRLWRQHAGRISNIYQKQLKHLQHTSKTLTKHQKKLENTCVAIANIMMKYQHTYEKHLNHLNIYMQHHDLVLQHPNKTLTTLFETDETLETYT